MNQNRNRILVALIALLLVAALAYLLTRSREEPTETAGALSTATAAPAVQADAPSPTALSSSPQPAPGIPDCPVEPLAVYAQPGAPTIETQPIPLATTVGGLNAAAAAPLPGFSPAGDLLAYWSFDDASAVSDGSGLGNDGTAARPAMLQPEGGRSGGAAAFQAPEDAILTGEETSLPASLAAPTLQRTVAMWLSAVDPARPQLLYEEGDQFNGLALRLNNGVLEAVAVATSGETQTTRLSYPYPADGGWHHVAVSFNNGVFVLYVDGEPVAYDDNLPFVALAAHPDPAAVGNAAGGVAFGDAAGGAFTGLIDDVFLFGKEVFAPEDETAAAETPATPGIVATPPTAAGATVTIAPTATAVVVAPPTATLSALQPTAIPATLAAPRPGPFPTAAVPPPAGSIQGVPLLELPFPYDGGNERFGGNPNLFRSASQGPHNGGRVTSYYDHLYPLYPAPQAGNITNGREPADLPFGGQMLPFDGILRDTIYSGHPGFDFAPFERGKSTTPLFAAADGVIRRAAIHSESGAYFIEILHSTATNGDFLTRYLHLEPDDFFEATRQRVGQPVAAGERIGTIGNTGWSTGHHLHFEVRRDANGDGVFVLSETVDPFGFIPSVAFPEDPWQTAVTFVDGKGRTYAHPGSPSYYLWKHALGRSAQIPVSGGGQLTQYEGTGGEGGAELCAPDNALPPGSTVNWSWIPDPPPSPELVGTGHGCTLSAIRPDGAQITRFDAPVRVVVPFDVADLGNIENPAETLAIYWQRPGSASYEKLDTVVDLAAGLAMAETEYPGICTLAGLPNRDLVPPQTVIEVSGPAGANGAFSGPVTVSLTSADEDVAFTQYSLDGGNTWRPYTGPFGVPGDATAMGLPKPPAEGEGDEGLIRGPGRYLVLAASRDQSGNEEYPPASRIIVIEPFLLVLTAQAAGPDGLPIGGEGGEEGEEGEAGEAGEEAEGGQAPVRVLSPTPTRTPVPIATGTPTRPSGPPRPVTPITPPTVVTPEAPTNTPEPTNTPFVPTNTPFVPTNTPFVPATVYP